ncbi:MAG: choice-of-anchor Q domain-containing protein, partial [Planctomycetota bacterium]
DPDARDVELYETILSGDLAGNDGPGLFDNNDENSLHVTTGSGTDVTAVIDGFTITAGNANGPGWPELDADAGGMLNDAGSPWINDCRLEANWATEAGAGMSNNWGSHPTVSDCAFRYNAVDQSESPHTSGGMYNWHSDPTITNCLFESNSAGDGGGMGNEQSSPTITGCQFIGNSAWSGGGGMINLAASPTVTDCVFLNNTVDQTAWPRTSGGMYNGFGSNSTVTDCLFQGNSAGDGGGMGNEQCSPTITNCQFIDNSAGVNHGGAIINVGSSPRITDCEFIENSATLYGGAIRNSGDSTTTVTGCTFDRNTAQWGAGIGSYQSTDTVDTCTFTGNSAQHGGGMGFQEAAPTVVNCLLVDNTAVDYGGGMVTWTAGHPTVINSTFRNNTGAIGAGVYNHEPDGVVMRNCIVWENNGEEIAGALALVSHSDIQGGYPGDGNIDADPLFVDPANDYYRLSAGSPCIDAGDNEAVPTGQNTDLDGNLRFVDDPCKVDTGSPPDDAPYVDMGAYEFQGCSCDLNGDGSVGVNDFLILLAAWGPCADCNNCPADFDGDCEVGVTDFLQLLANWGPCP